MIYIHRETYERNSIEKAYQKHIEERLDYKRLQEITMNYHSDHRKQIWNSRRTKKNSAKPKKKKKREEILDKLRKVL